MSYELSGNILLIEPTQSFASGFCKREFIVTTADKYPQTIKLEFTKEKCAQLDGLNPGDPVRVHFNLRGSEYQGKYYTNLQAWKIEADGATEAQSPTTPPPSPRPTAGSASNRAHTQGTAPQQSYPKNQYRPAPTAQVAPQHTRPTAVTQTGFYSDVDEDEIPF